MAVVEACEVCGRERDGADVAALAWVHESGPDGSRWICPECARRHVRDIEAKLAPEWWARDT
jgi:hypothetical protein